MDEGIVQVKIKSDSGRFPEYETSGSAGMDIAAYMEVDRLTIYPGKRAAVGTGLYMELPAGYEAQIRARSGLALKHGIGLVNGVGTIDSDYRGEIKVLLINWGEEPVVIKNGDRIAQMVISRHEKVRFVGAGGLSETDRGRGGFGHTGV